MMLTLYSIITFLVFARPSVVKMNNGGNREAVVYDLGQLSAPDQHTFPDFKTEFHAGLASLMSQASFFTYSFILLNLLENILTTYFVRYQALFEQYPLLRLKAERLFPYHFFW